MSTNGVTRVRVRGRVRVRVRGRVSGRVRGRVRVVVVRGKRARRSTLEMPLSRAAPWLGVGLRVRGTVRVSPGSNPSSNPSTL